jgi:hypothetical protein
VLAFSVGISNNGLIAVTPKLPAVPVVADSVTVYIDFIYSSFTLGYICAVAYAGLVAGNATVVVDPVPN